MMVNQSNNNSTPWPSTIPQQMPWMSSHQATLPEMQFGQPVANQILPTTIANPTTSLYDVNSTPTATVSPSCQLTIAPGIPDTPNTCIPSNVTINPFGPCIAAQNIVPVINQPQIGPQYPTCVNSTDPQQYATNSKPGYYQSLTPMASNQDKCSSPEQLVHHKRNSIEMEDEQIKEEEPPTKQQLSENRLFNRFGSLHLDGGTDKECYDDDQDSSSSDDEETTSTRYNKGVVGRKEFSRYVYLLFKEKKSADPFNRASNSAFDRLLRDERERLSKAVILWSPPQRNSFVDSSTVDSDDDEDFNYSDHKDFLKKPTDDSIIITEITDDEAYNPQNLEPSPMASDDNMVEE